MFRAELAGGAGKEESRSRLTRASGNISFSFMGTKTITLSEAAYRRLRARRRGKRDSFSQIVMRAKWDDEAVTAGDLLEMWRGEPPFFSGEDLAEIESTKCHADSPVDKWSGR